MLTFANKNVMASSPYKGRVVVFTGAGMSAESGIATFRDSGGLWARYRIEDVCTPEALLGNRPTVIEFYNTRRRELLAAHPNAGHKAILEMVRGMDVEVVTQNIDDLHERAAAEAGVQLKVTHLHGELRKLRSSADPMGIVPIEGWEQDPGERHPDGSLLRPFVVFFGESVPMFDKAAEIVAAADMLVIVGTSLAVYPAASLINYAKPGAAIYLIDPKTPESHVRRKVVHIQSGAAEGLTQLAGKLSKGIIP